MLDHLTNHKEEANVDSLKRITNLAQDYTEREVEMKLAEANFNEAKKNFNKVSMELIPEAMMQAGVNSFELTDGRSVSYKEELSASVKDYDKLAKFLEARGDDGLIKVSLEIGKVPQNILNKIMAELADKYGILAEIKTFVHFQTLKSYLSGLVGLKKNSVAEMAIAELDDEMVNVFTFYKTKVK